MTARRPKKAWLAAYQAVAICACIRLSGGHGTLLTRRPGVLMGWPGVNPTRFTACAMALISANRRLHGAN